MNLRLRRHLLQIKVKESATESVFSKDSDLFCKMAATDFCFSNA